MKRTVAIQDVHYAHGKPRHNQVLHVYHNWTDEELKDEADVVRKNDIEFRRLKRFIEAHDEIVEALHAASDDSLCRRQSAETVTQIVTLLNRIDGEEAE